MSATPPFVTTDAVLGLKVPQQRPQSDAVQRDGLPSANLGAKLAELGRIIDTFEFEKAHRKVLDFGVAERRPINERGGFAEYVFDLADSRFSADGIAVEVGSCYGLFFARQGSAPGAVLDVDWKGGGRLRSFGPGASVEGEMTQFQVRRSSSSVATGTVRLVLKVRPDVTFQENPASVFDGRYASSAIGPAGAATQGYNVAAWGANIPTAGTDGVSLAGVKGFRLSINAAVMQTISAFTALRLWQYDPTDLVWKPTDYAYSLAATWGRNYWAGPDEAVQVPQGRVYAELVEYTGAVNTNAPTVRIETWGAP